MNRSARNRFRSRVVVITGASSGIGKALALEALERGALVAVCARNLARLEESFREVDPNRVLLFGADVSREEDCRAFGAAIIARWGRAEHLICNAGISMRALFAESSLKTLHEVMNVNFWGAVNMIHVLLPHIRAHKGSITGISSIAGYRGLPGRTGYSASKFALQGFLEALRTELLEEQVQVGWISPGFTASEIRNKALDGSGRAQGETPLKESNLMSAETCARITLDAIASGTRAHIMTLQGRLTVWLNRNFPRVADRLVFRHFLNEPGSPLAGKK